jgi:Mg-chelatase subunit ChlI
MKTVGHAKRAGIGSLRDGGAAAAAAAKRHVVGAARRWVGERRTSFGNQKLCVGKRGGPSVLLRAAAEPATADRKVVTRPAFPFTRVIEQEDMKLGLLLNVIDQRIGGLLVMGDRGTGKSVVVRAVVDLLPEIDMVAGDSFNSSPTDARLMSTEVKERIDRGEEVKTRMAKTPLVELPLGATEDRVCGTLDVEAALQQGSKAFSPGLLAKANRGILYIDEVNLLDDSLVDVVLDAAAGGVNTVEREGISITHPASFIMIGTGNPEEGELRPQLLDRFGLYVEIGTVTNPEVRLQLALNRTAYDMNPEAFYETAREAQEELKERIMKAKALVKSTTVAQDLRIKVSTVCSLLDIDGIRGDMVVVRTAKAFAAYEGRSEVTEDDIGRIVGLCLGHRTRKDPLDPLGGVQKVNAVFRRIFKDGLTYEDVKGMQAKSEQKKEEEEEKKESGGEKDRGALKPGQWRGL